MEWILMTLTISKTSTVCQGWRKTPPRSKGGGENETLREDAIGREKYCWWGGIYSINIVRSIPKSLSNLSIAPKLRNWQRFCIINYRGQLICEFCSVWFYGSRWGTNRKISPTSLNPLVIFPSSPLEAFLHPSNNPQILFCICFR